LFWCVLLIFVAPLIAFGHIVSSFEGLEEVFKAYPSLRAITIWENFTTSIIVGGGIIIGVFLWQEKPQAVSWAKKYLLARIALMLFSTVVSVAILGDVPSEVIEAAAQEVVGVVFRECLYFGICFTYLLKSKRIRNTFG